MSMVSSKGYTHNASVYRFIKLILAVHWQDFLWYAPHRAFPSLVQLSKTRPRERNPSVSFWQNMPNVHHWQRPDLSKASKQKQANRQGCCHSVSCSALLSSKNCGWGSIYLFRYRGDKMCSRMWNWKGSKQIRQIGEDKILPKRGFCGPEVERVSIPPTGESWWGVAVVSLSSQNLLLFWGSKKENFFQTPTFAQIFVYDAWSSLVPACINQH